MKKRSPAAVFLLPFITFGIYSLYWAVKTKGELNNLGAKIPTAWIMLIPIVGSIWWWWKYSEGVELVTREKISAVLAFILVFLLGNIGEAILQSYYNKLDAAPATGATPTTPSQPAVPAANPPASPFAGQ